MILAKAARGKLLSPASRRACVDHVTAELGVSERRACQVPGQHHRDAAPNRLDRERQTGRADMAAGGA